MLINMMYYRILLSFCVLISAQSYLNAQPTFQKEDMCPDYLEIDPLEECQTVGSYGALKQLIENAPSGSEINLCPFFLRKVSSVATILVNSGVRVRCIRAAPNDFCTIVGLGNHLVINSAEDTLWQGLSFRGSNNHAVYITGEIENSESATHTFCHTSFMENVRTKDTRGGALMLDRSAGTVNVDSCFFQENYSKTYGASIYSRADQLNVLSSLFIKNKSIGYGPAIFSASGGNLMIKNSSFRGNNGRESHDIVFNPGTGDLFRDGFDNSVNDGDCRGVFNSKEGACIEFEKAPPTPAPTLRRVVTSSPTNKPTSKPTSSPTNKPTSAPSISPKTITARTKTPVVKLTVRPVEDIVISRQDTTSSPIEPTVKPTIKSTSVAPTIRRVVTSSPANKPTNKPTSSPTNKPTSAPSISPKTITARTSSPLIELTIRPVEDIVMSRQNTTSSPIEPTVKPTIKSTPVSQPTTMKPTTKSTPDEPTVKPTVEPTPAITAAPYVIATQPPTAPGLCVFRPIPNEEKCVEVESFDGFKTAVESGRSYVTFCGGFNIRKNESEPVKVVTSTDIRCINECSFFGIGPFLEVGGAMSNIRLKNMKFVDSQDSSAIIVSTFSSVTQTSFCDMEFSRNQVSIRKSYLGGAITVDSRSGVVNVVNSTFTGNIASRGGAIHSNGFKLNVIDSKFIANNAFHSGNAIFVGKGSLSVQSSTFILNTKVSSRIDTRQERLSDRSFVIAVQPDKSIRGGIRSQAPNNGGLNTFVLSGECNGVYEVWNRKCIEFT